MATPAAFIERFKGSALRPFLNALDCDMRTTYLAAYQSEIARPYAARLGTIRRCCSPG